MFVMRTILKQISLYKDREREKLKISEIKSQVIPKFLNTARVYCSIIMKFGRSLVEYVRYVCGKFHGSSCQSVLLTGV